MKPKKQIPTYQSTTPRVWIGCLASYNAGRLIGRWADYDEVQAAWDAIRAKTGGEEYLLADNEYFAGLIGEYTPLATVESIGECLDENPESFAAFLSKVSDYSEDEDPREYVQQYEDAFRGHWDSFRDYAEECAHNFGPLACVSKEAETLAQYFDYAAWERDLALDYTTVDADGGGVYVFASY